MSPAPYPVPANEEARLKLLAEYHIVDTPPEEEFDLLARLGSRLFDVPIVLISLIERDRQFVKANVGLDVIETSRDTSLCQYAILQDEILFVPDATKDSRFSANPHVLAAPFVRFYAAKPISAPTGERIGAVCLIDTSPRETFSSEDRKNLNDLAKLVMDQMEIHRLDHARTVSQARFENIAAASADAIICLNARAQITFWNRAAKRLFGYTFPEIVNQSCDAIFINGAQAILEHEESAGTDDAEEGAAQTLELMGLRKDGTEFLAELTFSTWNDGRWMTLGAIVRDVTEHRKDEERLFRLAARDPLTDLPNRGAWRECIMATLSAEEAATVFLLDLDGFKAVNDTLGHYAGDLVLKDVAARLLAACNEARIVARLGGDEFVVLYLGEEERRARALAANIVAILSEPYDIMGERVEIGVSVGIALAPVHSVQGEDLLGAADLALYRAKAAGRGQAQMFEPTFRELATARRNFEQALHRAYDNGEFELFYQPQYEPGSGRMTGAEAILHWNHPERGCLAPGHFMEVLRDIPVATRTGEWALWQVCETAAAWRRTVPDLKMGIDLFEAQFRSGRLVRSVEAALEETNLPPEALVLEVAESILLKADPMTVGLLQQLSEIGVCLAYDHFGTGVESIAPLRRHPLSILKIDQSLLRAQEARDPGASVVTGILYLGDLLGMDVIVDGVETRANLDALDPASRLMVQGTLFGAPTKADALGEILSPNGAAGRA
ncbi:EAL domain-containing protein [Acuticoccus sp. M5D2P5]|uniref:putative bifunctional diguanylate cyclase/phosphodiesterase n=1 Tax=Acuticoccus kalidii TaxID=2910977 RepID=UPI001F22D8FD|nr:EAL domain-containing protein [Acuticoccus kalidii]